MIDDFNYTLNDLHRCAERELNLRRAVYPRWVEQGRMSQRVAKREIAMMQAIIEHFKELEEKERLL